MSLRQMGEEAVLPWPWSCDAELPFIALGCLFVVASDQPLSQFLYIKFSLAQCQATSWRPETNMYNSLEVTWGRDCHSAGRG